MRSALWKKRVRLDACLSPGARLLATVLADLHYDKGLKDTYEELPVRLEDLARAGGWTSWNTVKKYRSELQEHGWLQYREHYQNGRQQPTRYRLTETRQVSRIDTSNGGENSTQVSRIDTSTGVKAQAGAGVTRLTPVLRSKYLEESGHEPRSGELVGDDDAPQNFAPNPDPDQPTSPAALAVANGWPPYQVALMTTSQRLAATTNPYGQQP